MSFGLPGSVSCTHGGIMRLLDEYGVDQAGKRAVVAGRSAILGKPAGMLLLARDATVTYCHSRTRAAAAREADIVVAAVGRPRLIRGQDVNPGRPAARCGRGVISASRRCTT
jgi:methylenetetrahydrofolate dehydrogenase (NADP+)/methenyltetrahydrofolate cyclohydrolase